MLYLNGSAFNTLANAILNLTLTSVVFELAKRSASSVVLTYLTLTSVVFELIILSVLLTDWTIFNFNKCCIWILHMHHK